MEKLKIDCSKTENYFNEKARMTEYNRGDCLINCENCENYENCELDPKFNKYRNLCGYFELRNPKKAIKAVQKWSDEHPTRKLTKSQLIAIRGRIAEGYNWIAKDKFGMHVYFYKMKPVLSEEKDTFTAQNDDKLLIGWGYDLFYDFVKFDNSPLYLPDLLKYTQETSMEGENE